MSPEALARTKEALKGATAAGLAAALAFAGNSLVGLDLGANLGWIVPILAVALDSARHWAEHATTAP